MLYICSMKGFVLFIALFCLPIICLSQYNYYYGNIHSHTAYSDGNQDSTAANCFNPAQSYTYAKGSYHIDFWGISEHNHYSFANDPGMLLPLYAKGLQQADTSNNNGTFVAMFGLEFGVISTGGHVITYCAPNLIGWETLSGNPNYSTYCAKGDFTNYWKILNKLPNTFTTLAHPQDGDFGDLYGAAAYNASADSQIVGSAIRSGYAFSNTKDYSDNPATLYDSIFNKCLAKGYHIGPTIDHDNHNTTFGRTNETRTVVLAKALHRDSIIAAYRAQRFYASDDWNAKVNFAINGSVIGENIYSSISSNLSVSISDVDANDTATKIEIYYGEAGSGLYPTILTSNTNAQTLNYIHTPGNKKTYYYYAKIKQKDGDYMWTSPIWVNYNTAPSAVNSYQNNIGNRNLITDLIIYPVPTISNLYLQFNAGIACFATLKIYNMDGREVMQKKVNINTGKNIISEDITELCDGNYFAVLQTENFRLIDAKFIKGK